MKLSFKDRFIFYRFRFQDYLFDRKLDLINIYKNILNYFETKSFNRNLEMSNDKTTLNWKFYKENTVRNYKFIELIEHERQTRLLIHVHLAYVENDKFKLSQLRPAIFERDKKPIIKIIREIEGYHE